MPVITSPADVIEDDLYVDLADLLRRPLLLKCEGFNFAGSIKLKAAAEMVAAARREGQLTTDSVLVESSSGNLGVALSVIAAHQGLRFVCVVDSKCNPTAKRLMTALGASVHVVDKPAPEGGLLGARISFIRDLCARDTRYVWTNQYANDANWMAHYRHTGPAIARRFPDLDVLFVGAGTTGTLMGCARYLRDHGSPAKVVAVDTLGSVSFGGPQQPRHIPGLGMAVRPPLLDASYVDDVVMVSERDAVRTCRALARRGFLFGGSTGTVVSGAQQWLDRNRHPALTAVAISPDLGERYLDTVFCDDWLTDVYGPFDPWPAEGVSAADTPPTAELVRSGPNRSPA